MNSSMSKDPSSLTSPRAMMASTSWGENLNIIIVIIIITTTIIIVITIVIIIT